MITKQDIVYLCEQLEFSLKVQSNNEIKREVQFVFGYKPGNYFAPVMHLGTTASIPTEVEQALFAEIFIDGVCVIREFAFPNKLQTATQLEEDILQRLMNSIFNCGVMQAYNMILKHSQK